MSEAVPAGSKWLQGLLDARAEIRSNQRLRLGLLLIAAVLWVWLLLLLQDQAKLWRADADEAQAQMLRLEPLRAATQWPQRAEDARKHLEAAKTMLWTATSQGLAEADLQDTLRSWAGKAGLPVRELSVSAVGEAGSSGAGLVPLRARMVLDMNRVALMSLLAELQRSQRVMMVDSLRLRPAPLPARAELEVRVLFSAEERKP